MLRLLLAGLLTSPAAFALSTASPTEPHRPSTTTPGVVYLLQGGVSPAGTYPSLRTALGRATDGDTLVLSEGSFHGPENRDLRITAAISLRSTSGPSKTRIDGQGLGRAFEVLADRIDVEGIHFVNGAEGFAGSVLLQDADATFRSCVWSDNRARNGAAGAVWSGTGLLRMEDCRFVGNQSTFEGGAITAVRLELSRCGFAKNVTGGNGSAVSLASSTAPNLIEDCRFVRNEAQFAGVVAAIYGQNLTIDRCTFTSNRSQRGASVIVGGNANSRIVLQNSNLVDNVAEGGGAAIQALELEVANCTIVGNTSSDDGPGGILAGDAAFPALIANCIVRNNHSRAPDPLARQVQSYVPLSGQTLLHCNVEGGGSLPTCIDLPARFVDPERGDYHLRFDSPCIDAGTVLPFSVLQRDIDGEQRIQGGGIDIGSDETDPV